MSIPILNLPERRKTPGQVLAEGLGITAGGLAQGLQSGISEFKEQKKGFELAKLLGLEGDIADSFAQLGPEERKLAVGAIMQQQKQQQQQQKEAAFGQALESIIGKGPQAQQAPEVGAPPPITGLGIQELGKLAEISQRESLQKQKVASQRVEPILKRADELREVIPTKEASLKLMKDSIQEGNLGFFSRDNIAQLTGIEGFRTAKGAAFITAGKEFFLGSIRRAGPRPNTFIEQQIARMMPQIGRSKAANETVAAAFQADLDVEKERLRITDELEQKFLDERGAVPSNLGSFISKELKPFAERRQEQLEKEMRDISGKPKGKQLTADMATKFLRAAKGDKARARELARKQGFSF